MTVASIPSIAGKKEKVKCGYKIFSGSYHDDYFKKKGIIDNNGPCMRPGVWRVSFGGLMGSLLGRSWENLPF